MRPLVPAVAEVLAGLFILWLAIRMREGRVPRGSPVGVRTRSTLRGDAAFETANKAAAPLTGAGGVVLAIGGVLAAVLPEHLAGIFIFGGVGVFLILCLLRRGDGRQGRPVRRVSGVPSPTATAWMANPARARPVP